MSGQRFGTFIRRPMSHFTTEEEEITGVGVSESAEDASVRRDENLISMGALALPEEVIAMSHWHIWSGP